MKSPTKINAIPSRIFSSILPSINPAGIRVNTKKKMRFPNIVPMIKCLNVIELNPLRILIKLVGTNGIILAWNTKRRPFCSSFDNSSGFVFFCTQSLKKYRLHKNQMPAAMILVSQLQIRPFKKPNNA